MHFKRVEAAEAKELVDAGWLYLDVRSVPEFEQGHAPGAVNLPILHATPTGQQVNRDFLRVAEVALPKDRGIVVGCASGVRSQEATRLLLEAGWAEVVDLRGGIFGERDMFGRVSLAGWATSGLPVTVEASDDERYEAILAKADAGE